MKRKLLLAFITTVLSTKAIAEEGRFYLRADIGANINHKQKIDDIKYKSKTVAGLDLGVGYNIAENFRTELLYTHIFNPQMKGNETIVDNIVTTTSHIKYKGKIDALMLKGYFDVYDFSLGKFFLGAGAGLAQVSENATTKDIMTYSTNGKNYPETFGCKLKKKNNFAYS